jgi:colicin import membrane protein
MSRTAKLDILRPRHSDRLSRGVMLALGAHVLLLIALSLGVSWRTSEPAGVEAELWAAVPQAAAPRAEPPPPPEPKAVPEPPKPTPRVEPPPPPPNRDAEIAREKKLEKERLEKQRELEEQEREREEKLRKLQQQKEQQKAEEAKREAEQKKREAAETARREADRKRQLDRIMAEAGGSGGTGSAAQSAGPSSSYGGRIRAKVKPNIVFSDDVAGNPVASVEVRAAPDGTILGKRLVKSSGVPAWDEAVLRAIDKTEVLPRDTDGRVPSPMVLDFRPRDL